MFHSSSILVFSIIIIIIISPAIAQPSYSCSSDNGNYTANSTYRANLHHILSSLPTDIRLDQGFFNATYGNSSDRVNAMALCRPDMDPDRCRSCITDSVSELPKICPNQREAVIWYTNCMLQYSDEWIYGVVRDTPSFWLWNIEDAVDGQTFSRTVQGLVAELSLEAAMGDSKRKFGAGNVSLLAQGYTTVYAMVYCTPDLSQPQCLSCLQSAASVVQTWCPDKIGAQIISPSCYLRYEIYGFFDSAAVSRLSRSPPSTSTSLPPPPLFLLSPPSPSPNTTTIAEGNKSKRFKTVIIIVLPIVVVLVLVILIVGIFIYLKARKQWDNGITNLEVDDTADMETFLFDINTIRAATDDFSDANKIGQGGFGSVYKGKLVNGQDIAVKRLSQNSMQGESEFKNEVLLVAKLLHRNLVRFLGFCLHEDERLLVYEFLPNLSLDKFIFDPLKRQDLDWGMRYKIIEGIVKGLVYLHEDSQIKIIHRDLKAANILLDAKMNPKISDFGMARLFQEDQTRGDTARIVGTQGYMAPEYAMHGKISVKVDVFSFGVLVLEIVTGQKNNSFHHEERIEDLISYAWKHWSAGTTLNVVDPNLRGGSSSEMKKCINIGLLCAQENSADRPTMETVHLMLNSDTITVPILSPPPDFMNRIPQLDMSSSQGRSYNSQVIEME